MGIFAAGEVVILPFPYSDLSRGKLRPILLLAAAGPQDWIVCQITSNPFADPDAIQLTAIHFATGGLQHTSYLKPCKLFTAHESLIVESIGTIKASVLELARDAVVRAICESKA